MLIMTWRLCPDRVALGSISSCTVIFVVQTYWQLHCKADAIGVPFLHCTVHYPPQHCTGLSPVIFVFQTYWQLHCKAAAIGVPFLHCIVHYPPLHCTAAAIGVPFLGLAFAPRGVPFLGLAFAPRGGPFLRLAFASRGVPFPGLALECQTGTSTDGSAMQRRTEEPCFEPSKKNILAWISCSNAFSFSSCSKIIYPFSRTW